ncbi:LuxR C-terminal-related transcriptional regulator [Streptomyces sp. NPDC127066]|uniref:LuxR C-terminal-related transcriptional regulator n=1 Tax=Streptomyces sp. NPDC127066 TaxID=3347125 RepID=UPI003668E6F5
MEGDGAIPRPASARGSTKANAALLLDPHGAAPAVVEILGQPWIGKTRLLHRIIEDAGTQGWSVAHAAAGPAATAAPYQLFSDAFDEIFSERAETVLQSVPVAFRRVLGQVFPALAPETAQPETAPVPSPAPAGLLESALRQAIRGLTGSSGLVLALDDVHWADPASLALLESLLRRPPDARLVIVVAHRDRQSPLRLRGLLASLPGSRRIELGPLSGQELDALLPDKTAQPLRRTLLHRAGGNPGLLLALAASPRAYGGTAPDTPGLAPFTRFLEEFRAVSDDGWTAAQCAAVLGDPFTLQELRSISALPGERLADAVAELLREDIVRPGELAADHYRFRHCLLRATAYHTTGEQLRLAAHTAATGLVRLPAPCVHTQAGPVPHRMPVADRVRSGLLPREAGPASGDATLIYEQRVRTGKALVVAGRPGEALDILDRTSSPGAEVPLVLRAEAAEWRARAQRLLGRYALAESLLEAVRPDVAGEPEALALVDLARLAAALERGSPLPGGETLAVQWATSRSDPLARGYAWALLGAQDADAGRTVQASARLGEVTALLDGLDDTTLIGRLDILYWLARALARLEQDTEAARHFERGLNLAAAHELDYLVPQFATGLAEVQLRLGRIDLAVESGHRAMRAAERIGGDCLLAEAGAGLARAAWISGDRTAALYTAREAAQRAEAWREPWADRVRLSLLETTFDTGDQELCKKLLSTGTVRRAASFPVVSMVPAVAEVLARLEGERRGSATEAGRWATAAEEAAGRMRLPGATGLALLARAHHHRVTDPLRAAVFASSAVVTLTRAGRPLDVVRAHLAVAAAWSGIDSAVARSQLDEAQVLLQGRGAHGYLDHAAGLATNAPSQPADARLAKLSNREREISVLVSDGCTNQQIARTLRLSHKTVETHLGRIFKKLDVGSRAQVATSIGRAARFTDARFADRLAPLATSDQIA